MKFFYRIFYWLAKREQERLKQPHSMRYLYYYNAKGRLGEPIKIIILLLLSLLTNSFVETLLAILAFGIIRIKSGGFHARSSNICLLFSILLLNTSGIISRYVNLNYITLAVIYSITITIFIIKFAKNYIEYKKLSILVLVFNILVSLVLILNCKVNLGQAIMLGTFCEVLTMTSIANSFMSYIERKVTFWNRYKKI